MLHSLALSHRPRPSTDAHFSRLSRGLRIRVSVSLDRPSMDLSKKRKMDDNGVVSPDAEAVFTPQDARRIIEPFTHEQLLEIVQNAAARHLDVLDAVRSIADRDTTQRKLFIRGLGWDTTTEKLSNLFSAYGDLEEAVVILDKATGKSKGYGFVTFKHVDGALLALKEPSKKIDGRMTVSQLAMQGNSGSNANAPSVDVSARKIYVANVPADMPADRLLAHFSSYGEVEEGPLGFDKLTGKSRGFALFVYKTAEAARASLVDPTKAIDGHQLACKLAIEGKKGKQGVGTGGPGGVQGAPGGDLHGDGFGLQQTQTSMPGSLGSHYGGPFGPSGISSFGAFSAGLQGPPSMGHHPHGMKSSLPSSLAGASGGQAPSSYGSGMGAPYGASPYGGPTGTGHGGLGSAGVSGNGLGNGGGGLGGAGGAGISSSLYNRLPASSTAMGSSGAYPESGHYSLGSSGYPSQHHQPSGTSPATRVPPGGMYQGIPPYY